MLEKTKLLRVRAVLAAHAVGFVGVAPLIVSVDLTFKGVCEIWTILKHPVSLTKRSLASLI